MPRRRRGIDLSGPTGRAMQGRGGGTTGEGRTENLGKYTPVRKGRAVKASPKKRGKR